MQQAGNTNAHAQCTDISIPKRDGHTYIHTYIPTKNEMQSRISYLALMRSAISRVNNESTKVPNAWLYVPQKLINQAQSAKPSACHKRSLGKKKTLQKKWNKVFFMD